MIQFNPNVSDAWISLMKVEQKSILRDYRISDAHPFTGVDHLSKI